MIEGDAMFEVGRDYAFKTGFGEDIESWSGEIAEVNLPLIKVKRWDDEIILNTGASTFQSAEILPLRSAEEKAAGRAKWEGLMLQPPSRAV